MNLVLAEHFGYRKLLRFTFPSICMMVFTSIYFIVDGFFISNYAGSMAFAAVNFIMPVILILGCFGFMIGTGGSALIGKTMGEGNLEKARKQFTLLIVFSIALSALLGAIGYVCMGPAAKILGCTYEMYPDSLLYGKINCIGLPFYFLQVEFQSFFVTAQKPKLGLIVTLLSGVTNMVLDYLLIQVLPWGVAGAAFATISSQMVGGLIPVLYFMKKRTSPLWFCRTKWNTHEIVQTCMNGFSELMSNVSISLVSILYNWQLLRYLGENGISAYGVLMYVNMVFTGIFFGYVIGVSPIISFQFGAQNRKELHSLLHKSLLIVALFSVIMFGAAEILSAPLSYIYVGYDANLLAITENAFRYYSFSFLFCGFAIFGSGYFTALNDGITSALIAFFRTMVFQVLAVVIFPILLGVDGIWLSIVAAEIAAVALAAVFLKKKQKQFGY